MRRDGAFDLFTRFFRAGNFLYRLSGRLLRRVELRRELFEALEQGGVVGFGHAAGSMSRIHGVVTTTNSVELQI